MQCGIASTHCISWTRSRRLYHSTVAGKPRLWKQKIFFLHHWSTYFCSWLQNMKGTKGIDLSYTGSTSLHVFFLTCAALLAGWKVVYLGACPGSWDEIKCSVHVNPNEKYGLCLAHVQGRQWKFLDQGMCLNTMSWSCIIEAKPWANIFTRATW